MEVSSGSRSTRVRTPGRGSARLSRVGLLSGVPLLLAAGAHLVGGGEVVPVGVLLGAAALLLVSTLVSVDRCRFAVLLPLLAAEQVLLHLLFSAADTAAMCLPSAAAGAHVGHAAHGAAATLDPGSAAGLQACAESHAMGAGWLMIGAHAAATLAVAWLLARGEAWWWRTVATLVHLVAARPTRRRPRALAVLARPVLLAGRLVLDAASPRGPPLCS